MEYVAVTNFCYRVVNAIAVSQPVFYRYLDEMLKSNYTTRRSSPDSTKFDTCCQVSESGAVRNMCVLTTWQHLIEKHVAT